jgi:Cys-rich protein (TIGR01571 family)
MSRQPRIDTSVRQQQVYSYVETPIELNAPSLPSPQAAETTPSQDAVYEAQQQQLYQQQIYQQQLEQQQQQQQLYQQQQQQQLPGIPSIPTPQPVHTPQQHPTNAASYELEQARQMLMQERRAFSPSGTRPPEHPALSAPYVEGDATASIHRASTITHSSSQYQSPPYAPAYSSLPEKKQPQQFEPVPTPTHTIPPITPDTNPLQSPTFSVHRSGTFTSVNQDSHDSFANHQPGQSVHPNQIATGGHWSTGLCECSDPLTCLIGLTCPCLLYGRTQYRLLQKSRGQDPTNMLGFDYCNGSCTCLALLCGCQCILATIQHYRTRKAYDIDGNICSDCLRASCCMCCTFIRNEREIKRREEKRAQAAVATGSTFVIPYAPPAQMQYQPGR